MGNRAAYTDRDSNGSGEDHVPFWVLNYLQQGRTFSPAVNDVVFPAHPFRISSFEALQGLLTKTLLTYCGGIHD